MVSKTITFRTKSTERLAVYRRAFEAARRSRPSIDWSDWLRSACDAQAVRDLGPTKECHQDGLVACGLNVVPPGAELEPPVRQGDAE